MDDVSSQEVPSENRDVYRGEYLAYQMLRTLGDKGMPTAEELLKFPEQERLAFVQKFMGPRYSESYTKGVHDADAANMLMSLARMQQKIGLLKYHTRARALASLYWHAFGDKK